MRKSTTKSDQKVITLKKFRDINSLVISKVTLIWRKIMMLTIMIFRQIQCGKMGNFVIYWKEELGFAPWRLNFIPRDELQNLKEEPFYPKGRSPEGWNYSLWRLQFIPRDEFSLKDAKPNFSWAPVTKMHFIQIC